ncbi:MAG: gamma-glutamyltransferase [Alphaproteobacteria bacterium]|nr:gamma-glutamyltransferase [Alphaproteobacteria bacterium]
MRRLLSTLTSLSFLLAPTLTVAQPAGDARVSEFNGARVSQKFKPPVEAEHGMAVSSQRDASKAGADILAAGGNAIDAAVAVGYALAVTHPCCGNVGGGGFATIHLANGKDTFINFREKAPGAASEDMYLDAKGDVIPGLSLQGYKAVGVPGSVMGFQKMLDEYGTMKRAQVMAPAIKLAEDGYILQEGDVRTYGFATDRFAKQPNVAAIFLDNGKPWKVGDRLVQKDLAATLKLISAQGPDVFYKGNIAERVVAASKANGGLLTMRDFADYTVTESAPLYCNYRGYRIISSPPPSSGGASMCEILNILSGYPMDKMPVHSAKSVHLMVEAMRHAYVDRNFSLGDPAFVKNPLDKILSQEHAAAIRAKIDPVKATPSSEVKIGVVPHESDQTTHYSVVDKDGNAVSVTYTINGGFGAGVIAGDTGFFLNNEMDDFTSKVGAPNMFGLVQGKNNAIEPGKRPLSSMSPTIITKDGKLFMVTGSPGGSRIITITLESILNVIDHKMDVQAAVDTPRIHHQWMPDTVYIEENALTPEVRKELEAVGYHFTENRSWGSDEAIIIGSKDGLLRYAWAAWPSRRCRPLSFDPCGR